MQMLESSAKKKELLEELSGSGGMCGRIWTHGISGQSVSRGRHQPKNMSVQFFPQMLPDSLSFSSSLCFVHDSCT